MKNKEEDMEQEGVKIGREDVKLRKELADIEKDMVKAIKSTDCLVQYDLCGLFVLTGFVEDKIKKAKKETLAEVGNVIDERIKQLKKEKDASGKKKVCDTVYLHLYDMIRGLKELKQKLNIK